MKSKGYFFTIEGIEGVGKTTQIEFIRSWLENNGHPTLTTREPGGTPMSESIREMLLAKRQESVHPMTELLLMFASRTQHYYGHIQPHLDKNYTVICDRYIDSTRAYQGYGRGVDLDVINGINNMTLQGVSPDLTFLLDIPAELGLARARNRGDLDRIEDETISFFNHVREGFLKLSRKEPDRIKVIDASGSMEQVQDQILKILNSYFSNYE